MSQQQASTDRTWLTESGCVAMPYRSKTLSVDDYVLVCTNGPHQGLELRLDQDLVHIGRADWCDIALFNDKRISRHHCEIRLTDDGIRVRDLTSSNGTFLNGVRVFDGLFAPDATLKVGNSSFVLRSNASTIQVKVNYHDDTGHLVGKSDPMRKIFSLLKRLGPWDVPVLLQGETGTGKSSVARALQAHSERSEEPLVTVNCGALPTTLVESLFFGYEKGAFTGADQRHLGYFEQANGGTLFLDEIGEFPLELQPKLLDVLERQCIRRLGGEQEVQVDFRLITATHRDLQEALTTGDFREDLYYRLAVFKLDVPALRDRLEDIPLLVEYILSTLAPSESIQVTPAALARLQHYYWPGNVRELENVLRRGLVFMNNQTIDKEHIELPTQQEASAPHTPTRVTPAATSYDSPLGPHTSLQDLLEAEEKRAIEAAIEHFDGNAKEIIPYLGLSRTAYYNRLQKYGLNR